MSSAAENQSLRSFGPVTLNETFYLPDLYAYTVRSLLLGDLAADLIPNYLETVRFFKAHANDLF